MVFFTADNHFGHANIIRHCARPFADVREMDETLAANWNSRVGPNDEVFVVGDLFFRSENDPAQILCGLHGRKHLIVGNHDRDWMRRIDASAFFVSVSQIKEIRLDGKQIVLCHYPMLEWPGSYHGTYLVFGHIHNDTRGEGFPFVAGNPFMLNAGVDVNRFFPVSFRELEENNRTFKDNYRAGVQPRG